MFGRIDHIGVAVADLEAALLLHGGTYGMKVAHRETVAEQGVEAVLLDVGENHVELLRPLAPDTPVGRFLERRGPGLHHVAYQVPDIEAALGALRAAGRAARRRDAAHRHPRLARRLPASRSHGRSPHRARATGYARRMTARRAAVGFHGGQVLSLRITEDNLTSLRAAVRGGEEGWYEVEAADGAVLVDLQQVVYLRVESDEHRVGF